MEFDQLEEAKARLARAREAYLTALKGHQSPDRISDPADREKAALAKEEYEQATQAFVDRTLEAGREKRPARPTQSG